MQIWGCFSVMEQNPLGNPYNSGIVVDDRGEIRLYYRKLHCLSGSDGTACGFPAPTRDYIGLESEPGPVSRVA